jgi:sigma-B regulation protein RsbU (phosphoserine phosphatase)
MGNFTPSPHQNPEPLSGRVLVVDDDQGNREMLAKRLVREGLSVEMVPDGFEALAALGTKEFDVVLLDVMMPLLDGYEVLRQAKENPATRDVPVIMISALDEIASVIRCIEAGAEDYLPKPFDPTLLRARLSACLEKKRLRDAEQRYLQEIEIAQRRLQGELDEAARYVRSIIPAPQQGPPKTDWKYTPSTELGGDAFGYGRLGEDLYVAYLIDVAKCEARENKPVLRKRKRSQVLVLGFGRRSEKINGQ